MSALNVCPPFRGVSSLRVFATSGFVLPSGYVLPQGMSSGMCPFFRGVFSPQGHVLPQDGVLSLEASSLPEGPLLLPGPCSPFRNLFLFQEYSIFPSPKGASLPKHPRAHLSRSSGVPLGSFIASCQQDQTHTEATVSVSLCDQGPTEDRQVEGVGVSVLSIPSPSLPDSFVRRAGNPYRGRTSWSQPACFRDSTGFRAVGFGPMAVRRAH